MARRKGVGTRAAAKRRKEKEKKESEAREKQAMFDKLLLLGLQLDPKAETFTGENALFFAAAAKCAYEKDWPKKVFGSVRPKFTTECFSDPKFDAEGFTMSSRTTFVVVFTGSESPRDWFQNFNLWLTEFQGAHVHKGFWDALNSVWVANSKTSLVTKLRDAADKGKKIWFAGHSLGGAMALLAGARATHVGIDVQGIYTFGQPLIGSQSFGEAFGEVLGDITYRVTYKGDPVPLIPPRGGLLGESDRRKSIKFNSKVRARKVGAKTPSKKYADFGQHYRLSPPRPELTAGERLRIIDVPIASALAKVLGKLVFRSLSFKRHDMSSYVDGLAKNRGTDVVQGY